MKTFHFLPSLIPTITTTSQFPDPASSMLHSTRPLDGEMLPLLSFTPEHLFFSLSSQTPLGHLDSVVQVSQFSSLLQTGNSRSTQTHNSGHKALFT